jgi:hypothetical protein
MDFFQWLHEWFTVDLYNFVVETVTWLTYKLIWMRIKGVIFLYTFLWTIASTIISDLALAARWSSILSYLPGTIKAQLEFFNVFTGLTWVFQSFTTKFVLNLFKWK